MEEDIKRVEVGIYFLYDLMYPPQQNLILCDTLYFKNKAKKVLKNGHVCHCLQQRNILKVGWRNLNVHESQKRLE